MNIRHAVFGRHGAWRMAPPAPCLAEGADEGALAWRERRHGLCDAVMSMRHHDAGRGFEGDRAGGGDSRLHGHGFGHLGRARRGMIKAAVLSALSDGPMHGYQVMQHVEELSGGAWRPSPGSVYPTLQEFEDRGLVRSEQLDGKRVYSLTDEGAAHVDALRDTEGNLPWMTAQGPVEVRMKLRRAVGSLADATRQVGLSGSDEMVDTTLDILTDARRRIYALLAEAD
ncbi:MAG: PadR family transcriptional regulator [Thermoleophilia bacterium]